MDDKTHKGIRSKAEQEKLQTSEVRYRRLFETAKDGILLLDADTGRITDANPFLQDMLGYSHNELIGKALWEIGPVKDITASQDAMRHLDLEGGKRNCEIGLRAMTIYPNGDVYFCDFLKKAIGNIYNNSLSEIYYADTANRQRKHMIYCDLDCQQTCKRRTPLWVKARAFMRMG